MNVTELARQLRINTKDMLEILPQYGFDIGKKAIKVDNKVAAQITKQWRFIKRDLDEKKRKEAEEQKHANLREKHALDNVANEQKAEKASLNAFEVNLNKRSAKT